MAHQQHQEAAHEARMSAAFALVDPGLDVPRAIKAGRLHPSTPNTGSWRDEICALVTDDELAAAGVTIADVSESVGFYTATEARVTRERIGAEGVPGYMVRAVGYRNGPAGP